jgi:solute carrier family 40 (iron-regulated transporter), member 1
MAWDQTSNARLKQFELSNLETLHQPIRLLPEATAHPNPDHVSPPALDAMDSSNLQNLSEPIILPTIHRSLAIRLYLSHLLSTWNSRLFEMGAVLFIVAIYPATLRPMSVYALVRNAAAMVLAPSAGTWIDRGDRLAVVRTSIIGQRLAVAGSCGLFLVMLTKNGMGDKLRSSLFAMSVLLACVEKLCSIAILVSVERDWVVVITHGNETARQKLNARMRRIDLFCKLLGPLAISLIDSTSTRIAIWVTLGMSGISVLIEYFAIAAVFQAVPALRRSERFESPDSRHQSSGRTQHAFLRQLWPHFAELFPVKSLPYYFGHPAFLPSFALALAYLTVLSFSGQMITFLLGTGYTSLQVGVARTISACFEISATWIAPKIQDRVGVIRAGIWFITWQMLWLAVGLSWFFASGAGIEMRRIFAASGLVGSVILSRIGLWGFDLSAQRIVQDEVNEQSRGSFSAVEASFQNLFELLAYTMTIVFSRPDQFRWPAVFSVAAVYVAGGLYAAFVRKRRGHLMHMDRCVKR